MPAAVASSLASLPTAIRPRTRRFITGSRRRVTREFDEGSPAVPTEVPAGTVALSSVVRVGGPFPQAMQAVMGGALIAESFEAAARIAPTVPFPVATLEGDVFRGRHVVTGGEKAESRGILATKREIKELREKIAASHASLEQLITETAGFEQAIAHATAAIAGLSAKFHRQEKEIVGVEGQSERAAEDEFRMQQRTELVATEISRVREEIAGLDARQAEASESIARLDEQKITADLALDRSAAAVERGARHRRRLEPEGGRGPRRPCRPGRAQRRRAGRSVAHGRRRGRARAPRPIVHPRRRADARPARRACCRPLPKASSRWTQTSASSKACAPR